MLRLYPWQRRTSELRPLRPQSTFHLPPRVKLLPGMNMIPGNIDESTVVFEIYFTSNAPLLLLL